MVGSIAIRLPGEETTFAVIGAVLVLASAVFLNTRSEAILGPSVGIPVALLALLAASFRSSPAGRSGSRVWDSTTTWPRT